MREDEVPRRSFYEPPLFRGLLEALGELTILPIAFDKPMDQKQRAYALISFPIIGLFFGVIGMVLTRLGMQGAPVITAWAIPVCWLILSGGVHFLGLCQVFNALLADVSREQRDRLLVYEAPKPIAVAIAIFVIIGKMVALQQGSGLNAASLGIALILIPMFSRYVAVLFAMSEAELSTQNGQPLPRLLVCLGASLVVVAFSFVSFGVALMLFFAAIVTALFLWAISELSIGRLRSPMLGACVECTELAMLFAVVIPASWGYNIVLI